MLISLSVGMPHANQLHITAVAAINCSDFRELFNTNLFESMPLSLKCKL